MIDSTQDDLLRFNGIDGDTGDYALPPIAAQTLAAFVAGEPTQEGSTELRQRADRGPLPSYAAALGTDLKRLDQTGWGLILPHDADPAVKEALAPLLALREAQAGGRFRIYEGVEGHRPDESKSAFVDRQGARHGAGPGPLDPAGRVPYYLLICAGPERIPLRFQSELAIAHAVGRIGFETLDEYANYARGVVACETRAPRDNRRVHFFAPANPGDRASARCANRLVAPLRESLGRDRQLADWTWESTGAEGAAKSALAGLLGGADTPAVLFAAGHGMAFPPGSPRQLPHQGALLCQDWPGPESHRGPIPEDFYFSGDDLPEDANLLGLVAFFFASYGAATPELDDFARHAFKDRDRIAPRPFLAGLPTRMLGLPRGGALAAIGHADRAWGYSFPWKGTGEQTEMFRQAVHRLLAGYPVGAALDCFSARHAALATVLGDTLAEIGFGGTSDAQALAGIWTADNDACGYTLIGDPAVHLPIAEAGAEGGVGSESGSRPPPPVREPARTAAPASGGSPGADPPAGDGEAATPADARLDSAPRPTPIPAPSPAPIPAPIPAGVPIGVAAESGRGRILVIGGTGNLSYACSAEALACGLEVFNLNRGSHPERSAPGTATLKADIRNRNEVRAALGDLRFAAVVDFISYTPEQLASSLTALGDRTDQYVFIGTASAYRKPPVHHVLAEGTPLANPFWGYSRDKIACERLLEARGRDRGLPYTIVRPSHTYGPGWLPLAFGSSDFTIAARMLAGQEVVVHGDGQSLWTLTHARDFAVGLVGLLGHPGAVGEAVQIMGDEALTWDAIHRTVAAALGVEPRIVHMTSDFIAAVEPDLGARLLGDKTYSALFDCAKLKRLVPGFRTTVPFHQGVRESVEWLMANPARRRINPKLDQAIERILAAWHRAMAAALG